MINIILIFESICPFKIWLFKYNDRIIESFLNGSSGNTLNSRKTQLAARRKNKIFIIGKNDLLNGSNCKLIMLSSLS